MQRRATMSHTFFVNDCEVEEGDVDRWLLGQMLPYLDSLVFLILKDYS